MQPKLNLIITGAHSYIAQNFIKEFSSVYHIIPLYHKNYHAYLDQLEGTMATYPIDGILHFATKYAPHQGISNISAFIESNILFGIDILNTTLKYKSLKFFFNISTPSQYPINHPLSLYGSTKQYMEYIIKLIQRDYPKVYFKTLFMGDVFGINDPRDRFIYKLMSAIAHKDSSFTIQYPKHIIAPVYVDNVIHALHRAIQEITILNQPSYRLFHEYYTIYDFIQLLSKILGKKFLGNITQFHTSIVKYETNTPILPNWKETISLQEGIQRITSNLSL